ncbi:MAG: V-type ATP synthase subunit B [Nitrospirae bacterium]|nr:MAG: V-type ATP synthase subunit B [Nitrospirota bacterium]
MRRLSGTACRGLQELRGPLLVIEGVSGIAYGEMVQVRDTHGELRYGRVLEVRPEAAVIEVFEGTAGLGLEDTTVQFLGTTFELGVSSDMVGRVFDGLGRPNDGLPAPPAVAWRDINGRAINPLARDYPREFIQTGISAIDGMNSLIRGQKLPIFSAAGLPHNELAAQLIRFAKLPGEPQRFAIVFGAMGIKHDEAELFRETFAISGLQKVVMFLNLADEPSIARIITPRVAMTAAEYLAFDLGMHVLVVLTDFTAYGEAVREIATGKGEIPSRKGYPGYLYSDLASIYERAGRIEGLPGSITLVPILTMPNDDITHPIPDLTGYITEGQIVLDRNLFRKGIRPPVNVLPSLSRLMKDGIGAESTRSDHAHLANQLYAAYARAGQVERLAAIVGEEELSAVDKRYLAFGERFEREFVAQGVNEDRSITETLDLGWRMLTELPKEELTRVTEEEIKEHLP